MKLNSVGGEQPLWKKPSASSNPSPLAWTLILLITGPVWLVARLVAALCWLPSEGAYRVRVWAAGLVGQALVKLRVAK